MGRWLHNSRRQGGSPPLRSKGQNHRWPTNGPGGYITPTAWHVPTASERGAESKVAHKWAGRLHNPCHQGGSPPLRSGGQNHRWPTSVPGGYITPASWEVPTASERGAESQVAHKWAGRLHNPCHHGGSPPLRSGGQNHRWPTSGPGGYITPAAWGVPPLQTGGQNHRWPTSVPGGYIILAAWGVPLLQSGGQNHMWPTSGPGGYITLAGRGGPTASERKAESQVAHKCARWIHNPCRLGGSHRFGAKGRIRGGPQVDRAAT